jgi:hypothetical protein
MKKLLLAALALTALNMTAFADERAVSDQDEFIPADQLSQQDGAMDSLLPPPPFHPPHPHPVPPPHPYPHPVPPPHPYPHPVPPPYYPPAPNFWYECASQDQYGTRYFANGQNPNWVQQDVHNHCEYMSNGLCWDVGCRRY